MRWIIPARAGFTGGEGIGGVHFRDHPRSRGVYAPPAGTYYVPDGSSPLARGLLLQGHRRHRLLVDHPRSRGVYDQRRLAQPRQHGSSPLARGLRVTCVTVRRLDRIIPARAGFTRVFVSSRVAFRDHPRSRGVYPSACRALRPALGSSPLARGLRERQDEGLGVDGIIPARAGFTRRPRGTERRCSDHPRSRGVYVRALTRLFRGVGSSPLARGLRAGPAAQGRDGRIIPARAGFTRPRGRCSGPGSDHPRSRGVYPTGSSSNTS